MARGGKRPGAGRPRKPLSVRIEEGLDKVSHRKPQVLSFPDESQDSDTFDIENQRNHNNQSANKSKKSNTPLPTFLEMVSKEGDDSLPSALVIYNQTLDWIIGTGCEKFVPKQLIEDFAFTRRSYLESEYMNKKLGRVMQGGKQSPYVRSAIEYLKQTTALYREIWSIVAQNSTTEFGGTGNSPNAFLQLLQTRGF